MVKIISEKILKGYWHIIYSINDKGYKQLSIKSENGTNFSLFDDEIIDLKNFINTMEKDSCVFCWNIYPISEMKEMNTIQGFGYVCKECLKKYELEMN